MGTKNNPGAFDCYAKAEPDEPMFILLGRDKWTPLLIRLWVELSKNDTDRAKHLEAMNCAIMAESFRAERLERLGSEKPVEVTKPHIEHCPLCGPQTGAYQAFLTEDWDVIDNFTHSYTITCPSCGIQVTEEYEADVLHRWNTRPGRLPDPVEEGEPFETETMPNSQESIERLMQQLPQEKPRGKAAKPRIDCQECNHCGMDMDMEPYCSSKDVRLAAEEAHPLRRWPNGLSLKSGAWDYCKNKFFASRSEGTIQLVPNIDPTKPSAPQPSHYALIKPTNIFVKEFEFFKEQGGLTDNWGKHWVPIYGATSIGDARRKAAATHGITLSHIHNGEE